MNSKHYTSIFAALNILLLINLATALPSKIGVDFYNYWIGVAAVRNHPGIDFYDVDKGVALRENYYRKNIRNADPRLRTASRAWHDLASGLAQNKRNKGKLQFFVSTPFLYCVMTIFNTGNYSFNLMCFYIFQLLCFFFSITVLMMLRKAGPAHIFAAFLIFSYFYFPFISNFRVGNVAFMQLAFIASYFLLAYKAKKNSFRLFSTGLVLGFSVLFKPNLIFVPCLLLTAWLANKEFFKFIRVAAGLFASAVIAFVITGFFFSNFGIWFLWLKAVRNIPLLPCATVDMGNLSVSATLNSLTASSYHYTFLPPLILIITLLAVIILIHRQRDRHCNSTDDSALFNLGIIIFILSAPLVWVHYYMLLLPVFIDMIYRSTREGDNKILFITLWTFIFTALTKFTGTNHTLTIFLLSMTFTGLASVYLYLLTSILKEKKLNDEDNCEY